MAWTNLSFAFGSVLTSTKMTQMQDNFTALAQAMSGAPEIYETAVRPGTAYQVLRTKSDASDPEWALLGVDSLDANSVGQSEIAASAVGQGELKSSLQRSSASLAVDGANNVTFTGSTYTLGWGVAATNRVDVQAYVTTGYTAGIRLYSATAATYYFQARYISASPPYDLGDGEIPLFVFIEINPAGDVVRVDVAPDPPWAYNGPTDIRPSRKTKDGRKFRRVREIVAEFGSTGAARLALPRAQFVQRLMTDALVEQEITQAIKQADMPLIPHPFVAQPPTPGNIIALLDGQSPMMARLLALHEELNPGDTLSDLLHGGYIRVDNVPLARRGPPGVITVAPRWNLTP